MPWEQDFDAYLTFLDEAPASFIVDLAAAAHAPIAGHDKRVQVRVPMMNPRDDGLRSNEEANTLGALEDAMAEILDARCGALFVGHLISEGVMHIVFYAPSARIEDEAMLLDGLDAGNYEVAWLVEEDPEWGMYFEFMFPEPLDFQLIQNRRLIQNFTNSGDELGSERLVDHSALFDDEGRAGLASAALRDEGFAVDTIEQDEGGHWVLNFHRLERLDEGRPDAFCLEIIELLEPFGAAYDGWGAPLMRQPERH